MGWIYKTIYAKPNGKDDIKAEIYEQIDPKYEVLKSSIVGSACYIAARNKETGNVSGHVVLFDIAIDDLDLSNNGHVMWSFGTKFMTEDMIPYFYDCPKSILDLLTETDNENSNEWRKLCADRNAEKARGRSKSKRLKDLPINSVITFKSPFNGGNGAVSKGDEIQLRKVLCRGKEIWSDGKYKWKASLIPDEFAIA